MFVAVNSAASSSTSAALHDDAVGPNADTFSNKFLLSGAPISDAVRTELVRVHADRVLNKSDDPFYIVDLDAVVRKFELFTTSLPRFTPHYAVKCNPAPDIVRQLADCGCSFDCASQAEYDQVLALGVAPDRIVFANAIKRTNWLTDARDKGITLTTFDCEDELDKIKTYWPEVELLLRVATNDSSATSRLSEKFGAAVDQHTFLIDECVRLGLKLVGVAFHVGSGQRDTSKFREAIETSANVFELMRARGFTPRILDIGGGFPGADDDLFEEIAAIVNEAVDDFIPADVRLIAEPGRFFATESQVLAACVVAVRKDLARGGYKYFLSDGVYSAFNNLVFDHYTIAPLVLNRELTDAEAAQLHPTTLFGPTCDSIDRLTSDIELPALRRGDWLVFRLMGAYTNTSGTTFNGIVTATRHPVLSVVSPFLCAVQEVVSDIPSAPLDVSPVQA